MKLNRILGGVRARVRSFALRGTAVRCPLCDRSFRRFDEYRDRPNAKCPRCASLERHRLQWSILDKIGPVDDVLHFAPERRVAERLAATTRRRYLTVDLMEATDVAADITTLPFRTSSFDLLVCCHVLEHVRDDRSAMTELFRVLRPGGRALIQVPLGSETTDEDFGLDAAARTDRYGQHDHVRLYGDDIAERLRDAGFDPRVVRGRELPTDVRSSVPDEARAFVCRRAG